MASILADTHKISAKAIQRILRHKNLSITERYIQNINNDLKATINLLSTGGMVKIHEKSNKELAVLLTPCYDMASPTEFEPGAPA